jgi:lactosylceramide 4-alpha-galactosyltransferase
MIKLPQTERRNFFIDRFFTLWKYGGTYLDLDVVLLKQLSGLKNYAVAESEEFIGSAVLSMERGSKVARDCVEKNRLHFKGAEWISNGPAVITEVLNGLCETKGATNMTLARCKGQFQVRQPLDFYPVPYQSWRLYYDEQASAQTMHLLQNSFGVHVWNKLSSDVQIQLGSKQPYALIAARHCPKVYFGSGSTF